MFEEKKIHYYRDTIDIFVQMFNFTLDNEFSIQQTNWSEKNTEKKNSDFQFFVVRHGCQHGFIIFNDLCHSSSSAVSAST